MNAIRILDWKPVRKNTLLGFCKAGWLQNQHRLPATRCYRTRSGGLHAVFQHAPGVRNVQGEPIPGVDVRGEGGYVIWWFAAGYECLDHSAPVAWPTWLSALLATKAGASVSKPRHHALRPRPGTAQDLRHRSRPFSSRWPATLPSPRLRPVARWHPTPRRLRRHRCGRLVA